MAKDLYESRQMTEGPLGFILLIPVGAVILFFLFDVCFKLYNDWKLLEDTKTVLTNLLDKDGLETPEEFKEYAYVQYERLGYAREELEDMSIIYLEDGSVVLVNYKSYFSMISSIFGGNDKISVAKVRGYYNEYKETVVEEFVGDEEEDLIEDNTTTNAVSFAY
jgi:hypothetical protein